MGPLNSPVFEKFLEARQVPREPPPDLDAPGGGLRRRARERERISIHARHAQALFAYGGLRYLTVSSMFCLSTFCERFVRFQA